MAAQSKTTAVHISLIVFVMLTVIFGVVALLFYNDYRNQQAQVEAQSTELSKAQTAVRSMRENINDLKKIIGIQSEKVGAPGGAAGGNSVIGQAQAAIETLGTNSSETSFLAALRDLRGDYNNATKQLAQKSATIKSLQARLASLEPKYEKDSNISDQARLEAEQTLTKVQAQSAETIASKEEQINNLRDQTETLQTELDNTKERLTTKLEEAEQKITNLSTNIGILRDQLDKIHGMSFEKADGKIRSVDQVGRTVWINIGSDAGLRKGVTFSVYKKNNRGIGREFASADEGAGGGRAEDIKAKIEVTQIMGPKMAEARITSATGKRPIAPGDPIYTPLWDAGRKEKFAFIGQLDIDGDGSYKGDRQRLHQIVEANGSEVVAELLVTGERRGGEINHKVRFLVLGELPSAQDVPPDQMNKLKSLLQKAETMKEEARMNGVRIISLNTFLDFIGFSPQQKVFVPGESQSWTLNTGMPERPERSSSRGSTSALFDQSRNEPVPSARTPEGFGGQE